MKRLFLTLSLLCLSSSAALAHDISSYADELAVDCTLNTLLPAPSQNTVYIVHKFNPGSAASQFKIIDTSGLFFASMATPYLFLGTWNTDLSLAYGGCVVGQHVVATLNFFWLGTPMTCANYLETAAAPTSPIPGEIAVVDCSLVNVVPASGGKIFFGPGADQCGEIACGWNPVRESTWGSVKALYR